MSRVIEVILHLRGGAAYALIFLLPALESSAFVGFLFPGELAVVLGGVLAYQGRVSLPWVAAARDRRGHRGRLRRLRRGRPLGRGSLAEQDRAPLRHGTAPQRRGARPPRRGDCGPD